MFMRFKINLTTYTVVQMRLTSWAIKLMKTTYDCNEKDATIVVGKITCQKSI